MTSADAPAFTLFVNTHDTYDDCWEPFFALLRTNWPDCPQPVVLNTNRRIHHDADVDVVSVRNASGLPPRMELPWGERLRRGLSKVTTEFVLYIVEDSFIDAPVRHDEVARLVGIMQTDDLQCVRLVEPDGCGPYLPSTVPDLWQVDPSATYLAHLNPSLWRTDFLSSLIMRHEDPWQFEIRGGDRIRRTGVPMHTVDREVFWEDPTTRIVPIDPRTGIARGLWRRDVIADLFAAHDIDVDLEVRGSLTGEPPQEGLREVLRDRVERKWRMLRWHARDRRLADSVPWSGDVRAEDRLDAT